MKVVLFCGGQGLRIREVSESIPKPMVPVGSRPILWHVMRYYAHFGHKDFILCLGYRAEAIKAYFLHHEETSNDFVLSEGGRSVQRLSSELDDWRISFIDTGVEASVGQRLRAVAQYLDEDDVFLANYGDVLTNAPLDELVKRFVRSGRMAAFLAVRPLPYTFHVVRMGRGGQVTGMQEIASTNMRINGGYFIFRKAVLNEIQPSEDLVPDVFPRLIGRGAVMAFRYDGFWAPMDTVRDWQRLEAFVAHGDMPWAVW